MKIEWIFENVEYGIQAVVRQIGENSFAVLLHDMDAKMHLPTMKIFRNFHDAEAFARSLVA